METDKSAATSSIDWSMISKVYHNLPVIFTFFITWAITNKDFSAHELIQLYKVCQHIAWLLNSDQMKGVVYERLGTLYQILGQYKIAMEYLNNFLEICRRACDERGKGEAYGRIGNVHCSRGENKEAMECYKKALKICQKIGYLPGEGMAHNGIGHIHKSGGEYKEAMVCYEKALGKYQQAGELSGEGMAISSIGHVHHSLGQYKEAMECYEKHLKICQQTRDVIEEGSAHNNIGIVHQSCGEYKEAKERHKKALKICQQKGDLAGVRSAYGNIGSIHQVHGEYKESLECHKTSLRISQQIGDLEGVGKSHTNIGNLHQLQGDYKEALESYKKALKICQQTGDLKGVGVLQNNIGHLYTLRGDYMKAIEYFKKKLKTSQQIGDLVGEALVRSNMGVSFKLLHEWCAAESHLKESLCCYEKLFSTLSQHDQSKVSIVDTYIKTYKVLTVVLVQVEKIREALLISERGRSQALRDKLLEQYKLAFEDGSTVLDYSDAGSRLISSNDSTFIAFSVCFGPLFTFIISLKENVTCKELSSDSLISIVKHDRQEKMIKAVLDSCVTKIINDANVHVHENRENTFEDRSMGQDDADVCEQEQLTRKSKMQRQEHEDVNTLNCVSGEDLLKDLYQALIAPIIDQLVEPEIVIIPEGPLFLVPFAALQSPDGQFISDTKRIRIGPSLTTLQLLKDYPVEKQSKTGALIVGGPIVRNVMFRGGFRKGFGDLPGAWEEATEIGKILNEAPLTKESATKDEVMRRLQEGVAVIHIATHGSADTGELLLAPAPHDGGGIPTEKNYMLTVQDISSCKINAQLVVLSCCHSGRGQVRAEGVVGLTRAFLAAGARSVLAALWEISDEGTLFFMMSFYGHLKRGESACTSLQKAMREMRGHPRWSHPYYWGSFFIVGHDVTI